MTVYNTGYVRFDRPLNDLAVQTLQDEWHGYWDDYSVGEMEWSIEDEMGADFEDDIQEMIDLLSPLGYVLNGEVQYYGDYEGKIYVENNKITLRSIEDTGLYEASSNDLLQILQTRGDLENVVTIANMAGYLEAEDKIWVNDDTTLVDWIVQELRVWEAHPDETRGFHGYFGDRLVESFGGLENQGGNGS